VTRRELEQAVIAAAKDFVGTPADWTNADAQAAYGRLLLALRALEDSEPSERSA
jgi:hypothetical protein